MKNDQNISVYEQSVHVYGRIWTGMALILMILSPVAICCYYNAWPPLTAVLKSLLGVAPMYWTVGIIEVFTFVPMLGTGGSYLGFVTGNLTNLKVPCALNAMEAAKVRPGSEEGEVISTIAIASSSIVTTLVIALGVFGWGSCARCWNRRHSSPPLTTSSLRSSARWAWCSSPRIPSWLRRLWRLWWCCSCLRPALAPAWACWCLWAH